MKITVLGFGNWGTVLALRLLRAGHEVTVWEHSPERVEEVRRTGANEAFLPGARIPASLRIESEMSVLPPSPDFLFVVLPTPAIRQSLRSISPVMSRSKGTVVVSASKGIEFDTGCRISEIVASELGDDFPVVALSGPNLAVELHRGQPSSAVAASLDPAAAEAVQELLSDESYRIYTNADIVGVEYGGALKNIIAIAAGVAVGLGFGSNTMGALLTRGLAEITRFGVARGASPLTFLGLSGLGDLVTTCTSELSRNHRCGRMLARGLSLDQIDARLQMVAEGVNTTRAVHPIANRDGISMPITDALYAMMFDGLSPQEALESLMRRTLKREDEFRFALTSFP